MSLVRWEPFKEIERWEPLREIGTLRSEMDRLFDRLVPFEGRHLGLGFVPSAEIEESDEAVLVRLEIPGLEAKDLDVQVAEDSVSIKGERKSETKTEKEGMMRSEFHYGRFERVIPLPAHIYADRAQAEYKNGILNLTLPKTEEAKKKVVKVQIS
jgi:HSP20 family protein